jgi:hypothetical protein
MHLFLRRFPVVGGLQLFALFCGAVAGAEYFRGHAATLIVTNTADSGPGSLRDTIAAANDGNTIQFDAALNGQTINLTSGELVINRNITIDGPSPDQLTVSSSFTSRIFHLASGHNAVISGLTIRDGADNSSGGVLNDHATLTIDNCLIKGNRSLQYGLGKGGGIYNNGSGGSANLTVLNSTVVANLASVAGGGIYNSPNATLNLTNSIIAGNYAVECCPLNNSLGSGGGIANEGTLTISSSAINENFAGAAVSYPFPTASGGGIWSSSNLTITNSAINGNIAGGDGGALYVRGIVMITNTTIMGNRAFERSGGGINITTQSSSVTIAHSTLTGNTGDYFGGAIINAGTLMISDTTISQNATGIGGGIYNTGMV